MQIFHRKYPTAQRCNIKQLNTYCMERNNFLRLPSGLKDTRNRAWFSEDSGYYSYETPIHCLYHLFDTLLDLRSNLKEVSSWMLSRLMTAPTFTAAWYDKCSRDSDLHAILGRGMFAIDEPHVYDIVHALSMGSPSEYRLTRGEVVEEWRLYLQKGGEI